MAVVCADEDSEDLDATEIAAAIELEKETAVVHAQMPAVPAPRPRARPRPAARPTGANAVPALAPARAPTRRSERAAAAAASERISLGAGPSGPNAEDVADPVAV